MARPSPAQEVIPATLLASNLVDLAFVNPIATGLGNPYHLLLPLDLVPQCVW